MKVIHYLVKSKKAKTHKKRVKWLRKGIKLLYSDIFSGVKYKKADAFVIHSNLTYLMSNYDFNEDLEIELFKVFFCLDEEPLAPIALYLLHKEDKSTLYLSELIAKIGSVCFSKDMNLCGFKIETIMNSSDDPKLIFWCLYALATLDIKSSISSVKKYIYDKRRVDTLMGPSGYAYLYEEAQWAFDILNGKNNDPAWMDRIS